MTEPREAATRSVGELTRHIVERHENERAMDGQHAPRPSIVEAHDAAGRALDGEPSIAFLARDALAPGTIGVYAEVRAMNFDKARSLLEALIATRKAQPFHPQKDPAHAIAARQRANELRNWRSLNIPRPMVNGRVNPGPERIAADQVGRAGGLERRVTERRVAINPALDAAWNDEFANRRIAATNRRQLAQDDGGPPAEAARLSAIKNARPPVEPGEAE